jgi:hypothetical protein
MGGRMPSLGYLVELARDEWKSEKVGKSPNSYFEALVKLRVGTKPHQMKKGGGMPSLVDPYASIPR